MNPKPLQQNLLTQREAIALIRKWQGKRTIKQFAEDMNVSGQLIRNVYKNRQVPGRMLGFRKIPIRQAEYRFELLAKKAANDDASKTV